MRSIKTSSGFTLMELMIVVAIVGILAAVAYPAYTQHVRKSHRAEAQSLLMQVVGRQQQYLLDTRSYAPGLAELGLRPTASLTPRYTVSVAVSTGTVPAFTATATPLGAQAADACGTLTINEAGIKSPATCW